MATHAKFYPDGEMTVPWNAKYEFPAQANKAFKSTPRLPPKNGYVFAPGNQLQFEFPADGYVNPTNTTWIMDVTLSGYGTATTQCVRFQNNIQSIINRLQIGYGSTVLEDILNYNQLVRSLTEWTACNTYMTLNQSTIAEGIGGTCIAYDTLGHLGIVNVRQKYIQGISVNQIGAGGHPAGSDWHQGGSLGNVPQTADTPYNITITGGVTRRYQFNLAAGLFNQDKLIPTKWMAAAFWVRMWLEQPQNCIFVTGTSGTSGAQPTYQVANAYLLPEMLYFDDTYDAGFLEGLNDGGVPIKYSTWRNYQLSTAGSNTVQWQIQEKSRSVKGIVVLQQFPQPNYQVDNGASFFDTSADGLSCMQNFQYRIGGRYYPPAFCQGNISSGSGVGNQGAEAFLELQKMLNYVGRYDLEVPVNTTNWAIQPVTDGTRVGILPMLDGAKLNHLYYDANGRIVVSDITTTTAPEQTENSFTGSIPSSCFAMATDLETSNGSELAGLNAEEQSDITFIGQWKSPQVTGSNATPALLQAYTFFDAMMVLKPNNTVLYIQ